MNHNEFIDHKWFIQLKQLKFVFLKEENDLMMFMKIFVIDSKMKIEQGEFNDYFMCLNNCLA